MALSEELPIFRAGYDLLEKVIGLSKDLPKLYRYSLGGRMIDACLDLLSQVYKANMAENKEDAIVALILDYRTLQMLLRVVYREKVVSSGRYAEMIKLLESIGKQATAWKNSNQTKTENK